MQNEYLDRFRDYTNVELLRITLRPSDYQPDAVSAATLLLSTRTMLPEEQEEAEGYYSDKAAQQQLQQEKIDTVKSRITDLFQPILRPEQGIGLERWLNLFLLVVTLQFAWSLYLEIKYLIPNYRQLLDYTDITILSSYLNLLYGGLTLYLLYKRSKWGWTLLLVNGIAAFITAPIMVYQLFQYSQLVNSPLEISGKLWELIYGLAILFYLWRDEVARHFTIRTVQKVKYAKRAVAILLSFGAIGLGLALLAEGLHL